MHRASTLQIWISRRERENFTGQVLCFSRRDGTGYPAPVPSLSRIIVGGTGRDIPRLSRPVPGFSNNPLSLDMPLVFPIPVTSMVKAWKVWYMCLGNPLVCHSVSPRGKPQTLGLHRRIYHTFPWCNLYICVQKNI